MRKLAQRWFRETFQWNKRFSACLLHRIVLNRLKVTQHSLIVSLPGTKVGFFSMILKRNDTVIGDTLHAHQDQKKGKIVSKVKKVIIYHYVSKGMVHTEFVHPGKAVNQQFYLKVPKQLWKRVIRFHPEIENTANVFLGWLTLCNKKFGGPSDTKFKPTSYRVVKICRWPCIILVPKTEFSSCPSVGMWNIAFNIKRTPVKPNQILNGNYPRQFRLGKVTVR